MKVLTFIIPAYNSQMFLDKCIQSMLVPEVLDMLEIIVVNDGSTDGTAQIAQKYCEQYPETVRLISQENKGHGGALNTGCAAATGKYLKVIDADDWVIGENLPDFVEALELCECDVVLTHHHTIDISSGEIKSWRNFPSAFGQSYTFDTVVADWRSFFHSFSLHGITYRTEFYQKNAHGLAEHVFYEDHEFATFPCCYAENIVSLDLFIYEYRIGDVTQSVSAANQLKRIGHIETVLQAMVRQYQTLPMSSGKQYAAMKIQGLLLSYLTTALLVDPDKKHGRMLARAQMNEMYKRSAEIHEAVKAKYLVFRLFNHLHISKATWDRILHTRIYGLLKRNHD